MVCISGRVSPHRSPVVGAGYLFLPNGVTAKRWSNPGQLYTEYTENAHFPVFLLCIRFHIFCMLTSQNKYPCKWSLDLATGVLFIAQGGNKTTEMQFYFDGCLSCYQMIY